MGIQPRPPAGGGRPQPPPATPRALTVVIRLGPDGATADPCTVLIVTSFPPKKVTAIQTADAPHHADLAPAVFTPTLVAALNKIGRVRYGVEIRQRGRCAVRRRNECHRKDLPRETRVVSFAGQCESRCIHLVRAEAPGSPSSISINYRVVPSYQLRRRKSREKRSSRQGVCEERSWRP